LYFNKQLQVKQKFDNLPSQSRALSEKELRALKKMRATSEQGLKRALRLSTIATAVLIGVAAIFVAISTSYNIIALMSGTIAVLSLGYALFLPVEVYKDIRKLKSQLAEINTAIQTNQVIVFPLTAKQFAVAKEYRGEGDLYIIETNDGTILYIWDDNDNLKKNFPAHSFEVYDDGFAKLIGRQLNPISEKVTPIVIDSKAKWAYLEKNAAPGNMTFEKKDFNKLVAAMQGSIKKVSEKKSP
jgi:hypothetical protein